VGALAGGAAGAALCGAANPIVEAAEQAKQKANIRAFSKIFRAPTKIEPWPVQTGTARQLCKYVARGSLDGVLAANHSTLAT
jgi:hypothetical protein